MRVLIWHVDYFRSEVTERGRSPLVEPAPEPVTELRDGLLALISVEKADEPHPDATAAAAAAELAEVARRVGARRVLLHSFAHLFAELARPEIAIRVLDGTLTHLRIGGYEVIRTPFGWFNSLEIHAKGHPLSRVARQIRVER